MASQAVTDAADSLSPLKPTGQEAIRGLPSTAAIGGHPIHPMIVPYPIACLTAVVATDIAARTTGDPFWSRASKYLTGAGIVSGLAAGAVGAIDYFTIRRAREAKTGKLHAYGNPVAIGLAVASFAMRKSGERPTDGAVGMSVATAGVLGVTAWAGAELSYRHMIGVVGHDDQHDHREKQIVA